jgi:voltage-gated potassium channel
LKSTSIHLIRGGLLLILIIFIGVTGYHLIDDYPLVDAIYMTIITVSTVGFGEVIPLSDGGKIFTSFLILGSLGVIAYFISVFSQQLIEMQMHFHFPGYNQKLNLKKMENHVIVVGYGRNGQQVVQQLINYHEEFVVIDQNHELVLNHPNNFIEGDATTDEVLEKAGIHKAKALVTSLPVDADNLFVALTARSLNPSLKIISRAANESSEKKMKFAGVNSVIMPEKVGGAHMATLVAKPDIVEFLEHLTIHDIHSTQIFEIMSDDLPKSFLNRPIRELDIRAISGANIIGFKAPDGSYTLNPSADIPIITGSKIFILGTPKQIDTMKKFLTEKYG